MANYKNLFMRHMDRNDIKYTDVKENVVKVSYTGDNLQTIPIYVFFDKDGDPLVSFKCWNIANFKGKEAAAKTLREASQMVVDFVRRMQWHDTKTDPPKKEDSDHDGKVLVWHKDLWTASMSPWYFTANRPDYYPYWMPLPEPPEVAK